MSFKHTQTNQGKQKSKHKTNLQTCFKQIIINIFFFAGSTLNLNWALDKRESLVSTAQVSLFLGLLEMCCRLRDTTRCTFCAIYIDKKHNLIIIIDVFIYLNELHFILHSILNQISNQLCEIKSGLLHRFGRKKSGRAEKRKMHENLTFNPHLPHTWVWRMAL